MPVRGGKKKKFDLINTAKRAGVSKLGKSKGIKASSNMIRKAGTNKIVGMLGGRRVAVTLGPNRRRLPRGRARR